VIEKDYIHYFVLVAFSLEVAVLKLENGIESKEKEKISWMLIGVQVTVLDLLYKLFVAEIVKKKKEFNNR
jgi:hypothetical protein